MQCFLRLSTPQHAQLLVDHFAKHLHHQSHGLDEAGTRSLDAKEGSITTELVLGKREELYWQKVPEKVRKQAVQKALDIIQRSATTVTATISKAKGKADIITSTNKGDIVMKENGDTTGHEEPRKKRRKY
jgi:hypothetical protein